MRERSQTMRLVCRHSAAPSGTAATLGTVRDSLTGPRPAHMHSLLRIRDARANYFPAALRNASLMRSCQPGPLSWKYSNTS